MNDKTLSIIIKAKDEASKVFDTVGERTQAMASKFADAAILAAKAGGVALAGGITLAAKASWDQVGAVQQATVALGAYEKNGEKVQSVLSGLLAYARSDLGVLFNRTDLYQAAQQLKIMGDNTDDLVSHVKIMSRSVGLGLSNWQELDLIVGRVGSTGRLTGDDFDNLTKAGYKLDPALRNTNISWTDLFKSLDKGIPADALNGQADTIQGLGIRMQTAFRGVGNAILGVDKDTNKFTEGGLGDRLTKGMSGATNVLNSIAAAIPNIITWIGNLVVALQPVFHWVAEMIGPSLAALAATFANDLLPAIQRFLPFLQFLAEVIGVVVVAAIWVLINVMNVLGATFSWIEQVVANVGQWFVDRWNNIRNVWSAAVGFFSGVASGIGGAFSKVKDYIVDAFNGAYEAVKSLPGKMVALFANIGGLIKNVIGNIDIPGPLGKVKDVIPGFAGGTDYAPGGMALVGERGPELVNLPRGSKVYSNSQTQAMAGPTNNFYGNIMLGNAEAVDRFADRFQMPDYGVGV